MLRTSDLDILLGRLPRLAGDEGIATETLYHEPTSVVARPGHPLVQRDIAVQDLREASWILPSRRTLLRAEIDEAFRAIGQPPPKPMLESVTVLVNQRLLADTDLLAFLPRDIAEYYRVHDLVATARARIQPGD